MVQVSSQQVWDVLGKQVFAVVGMVSARGEGRTVGIVPTVRGGALWFLSMEGEWKIKHLRANAEVSVTYPIAKRVPLMPWIKVPAATITFQGTASVVPAADIPADVWRALTRGLEVPDGGDHPHVGVRIEPHGDFVTYGIGTSLMGMRDTVNARGRVAVR